jgi:glutamine phosphoribosylpyrophosphate amidotransferase
MGGLTYVEAETNADVLAHFTLGRLAHLGPQRTILSISHGKISSVEIWQGRAYERPWQLSQISSPIIELMEKFKINCNDDDALKKLMKQENQDGDPVHAKRIPWAKHIDDLIDTGVKRAIGATIHLNGYTPLSDGLPITDYKKFVETESWRCEYGCRNQLVYDGKLTVPDREFFNMMKAGQYEKIMEEVGTAYVGILMNKETYFIRDPFGVKFLCYVKDKKGRVVLSTETRALEMVGFDVFDEDGSGEENFKHVPPGSVGVIEDGEIRIEQIVKGKPYMPGSFGWDYGNRPNSHLDGVSITKVRKKLGETLAEFVDFKKDGIVSFPPRSPYYQAFGFANAVGTEVTDLYIQLMDGREYLQGDLTNRKKMSGKKLAFVENIKKIITGKPVYLVDDSIVSGAHMEETAEELYAMGASEVYLVITSPPFVEECPFGAYVPPRKELAAVRAAKRLYRNRKLPTPNVKDYVYDEEIMKKIAKEVANMIGVNSVTYMPLKRREEVYASFSGEFGSLKNACMYCFGRPLPEYPIGVLQEPLSEYPISVLQD